MKTLNAYNLWLIAAAALMSLTFVIHVFAGGADIYTPLRNADLGLELKSTLSVVWHAVSLILILFAASLFWLSKNYSPPLACLVGLCQFGFVLLFIGYGVYDTGTLTILPQWTIFLVGVLLMWFGHKREA